MDEIHGIAEAVDADREDAVQTQLHPAWRVCEIRAKSPARNQSQMISHALAYFVISRRVADLDLAAALRRGLLDA